MIETSFGVPSASQVKAERAILFAHRHPVLEVRPAAPRPPPVFEQGAGSLFHCARQKAVLPQTRYCVGDAGRERGDRAAGLGGVQGRHERGKPGAAFNTGTFATMR
jgi:hypothetical protein